MFSYRHAFHVGNHADVLKHAILVAILRHLALKDKSFWVFDTHAGAGRYRLDAAQTRKNAEYRSGIEALWQARKLPALLADYRDEVARFDAEQEEATRERAAQRRESASAGRRGDAAGDAVAAEVSAGGANRPAARRAAQPTGRLPRWYPGSPWLALQLMRPQDRLRCFEAHPTEIQVLHDNLGVAHRRQVQVFGEDGFAGLKALLPPVSRRGLVVIDPSYEDKRDYAKARRTLMEAMERFATGTMMLWYPLVRRRELMLLLDQLPGLPGVTDWLDVRLQVGAPPEDGYGLYGSGVFVINPPYTLAAELQEAMPVLWQLLGQDAQSGWWMETSGQGGRDRAPQARPSQAQPSQARPSEGQPPRERSGRGRPERERHDRGRQDRARPARRR